MSADRRTPEEELDNYDGRGDWLDPGQSEAERLAAMRDGLAAARKAGAGSAALTLEEIEWLLAQAEQGARREAALREALKEAADEPLAEPDLDKRERWRALSEQSEDCRWRDPGIDGWGRRAAEQSEGEQGG